MASDLQFTMIRTNFVCFDKGHSNSDTDYFFDETLDKQFLGYRAILCAFFDLNRSMGFRIGTSLGELLRFANINSARNMRDKTKYSILIDCLMWYIDNGYLTISHKGNNITDAEYFKNVKYDDLLTVMLIEEEFYPYAILGEHGEYRNNEPFISITVDEFNILTKECDDGTLIRFLGYMIVKHAIGWRADFQKIEKYPKSAIVTQYWLSEQLDCAPTTARSYLQFFTDSRLLVKKQIKMNIKDKTNPYIYAVKEDGWEEEIKYGIAKFKKEVKK